MLSQFVWMLRNSEIQKSQQGWENTSQYPLQCQLVLENPFFLREIKPRDLVSSFIDAQKNLATQSKAHLKMIFLQVATTIRNKLAQIIESPNQRRTHKIDPEDDCYEDDLDTDSTRFLQMQRKLIIWFAGSLWEIMQYINRLGIQQFKVR